MNRALCLFIIMACTIGSCPQGQAQEETSLQVENLVKTYMDSLNLIGLSVSVLQNEKIIYRNSFGYSNLEHNVPMTDSSVFRIWSISKQICAVAVLELYEQGRLELDDRISSFLDSIPETWSNITIRQLLSNTGGIKDYLNDYPEEKMMVGWSYREVEDSVKELKFPAGDGWSYTNTGYWVLSRIVENITGKDYQEYLYEHFFEPLKMTHTQKMDYYRIVPNRVSGYRIRNGQPTNSTRKLDENHMANGDAELISTVNDLSKWTQALLSEEIIGLETLQKAWKPVVLNNGESFDVSYLIYYDENATYGMGWFISDLKGEKIVWTPGAGWGFSTTILTVPEKDLTVIVLCNNRRFLIADKMARSIASVYIN